MFRTIAGLVVGAILGLSTGVALLGTAVNGAIIFGPIGAILGGLTAKRRAAAKPQKRQTTGNFGLAEDRQPFAQTAQSENLDDAFNETVSGAKKLCFIVWNCQMRLLRACRLMDKLRAHPWLFAVIGFLLLAFAFPIGVVFAITGFVAGDQGVRRENDFRVIDFRST